MPLLQSTDQITKFTAVRDNSLPVPVKCQLYSPPDQSTSILSVTTSLLLTPLRCPPCSALNWSARVSPVKPLQARRSCPLLLWLVLDTDSDLDQQIYLTSPAHPMEEEGEVSDQDTALPEHQGPEFKSSASSQDGNSFAGPRMQPTGKISVKLPPDEWFYRRMEKLNIILTEV